MNMKRYFCKYAEEHEECVNEEFQLVYGKASEIRRLYKRLEKRGVEPEYMDAPKYNPDRTYGIVDGTIETQLRRTGSDWRNCAG